MTNPSLPWPHRRWHTLVNFHQANYPMTHHQISYGASSWMQWTDESMAEFARIADEQVDTPG